jgi:hypothetical protein
LNTEIAEIIIYFSSITGPITDGQGKLFATVCGTLQPSTFGRYSPPEARQFMQGISNNPNYRNHPDTFIYSLLQKYDQSYGTNFHSELANFYIEIATAAIAAGGLISPKASAELERFKSTLAATQIANIGQRPSQGDVVAQRGDNAKSAPALGAQDHNAVSSPKPAPAELEGLVLQDAMNREQRAKAALRAVLQKDGCSEEQVEEVMRSVDNAGDGDA